MFESIQGILKEKDPDRAIVETHGISYRLQIPLNTYTRLPVPNSPTHLWLSQVIREDAHTLYAFHAREERDLFEVLITLSGIGPKTALALIGHIDLNAFQQAIHSADVRLLSKIPGIGKKTAERLVIEMRDKFKGTEKKGKTVSFAPVGDLQGDAANALMNLGYNPLQAQKAVQTALQEEQEDLGRLITAALRHL